MEKVLNNKSLKINCVINYELKEGKIISHLIPNLPENFDFNLLEDILKIYNPTEVIKEEEVAALKRITDMLLLYIRNARNHMKDMENGSEDI
jgi:hypothetical protein